MPRMSGSSHLISQRPEVYQRVQKTARSPSLLELPCFRRAEDAGFGLPFQEHQKSMQVRHFLGRLLYMGCATNIAPATSEQSDEAASTLLVVSPFWERQGHESHENQLRAYLTLDPALKPDSIHRQTISSLEESCVCGIPGKPLKSCISPFSDRTNLFQAGTANQDRMSNHPSSL